MLSPRWKALKAGGRTLAVEVKSGATLAGDWFRGLRRFGEAAGDVRLALVYGGGQSLDRESVSVYRWRDLPRLLSTL